MTAENEIGTDDRIVVAYFTEGADAYRAIDELIDEGFSSSEIGAAFRTRRAGNDWLDQPAIGQNRGGAEENPAVQGSVGGAGSHDQAVTPAGLAPGSGNAFPAPSRPGAVPGGEIPSTLAHDLPSNLHSELPSILHSENEGNEPAAVNVSRADRGPQGESRRNHLTRVFGAGSTTESGAGSRTKSNTKFGTGEGHLELEPRHEYSETAFEGSFTGMGLGSTEARSLSGELSRGGAVVTVSAMRRASLAEAILERNHGRVRLERSSGSAAEADRESPVEIYGSMHNYYRQDDEPRRMAS